LGIIVDYLTPQPTTVTKLKDFKIYKICSGLKHSLLIDFDYNLYSFGENDVKKN
jgi:alpha-tubulin suppressor-like RCC1 family protein